MAQRIGFRCLDVAVEIDHEQLRLVFGLAEFGRLLAQFFLGLTCFAALLAPAVIRDGVLNGVDERVVALVELLNIKPVAVTLALLANSRCNHCDDRYECNDDSHCLGEKNEIVGQPFHSQCP